MIALGDEMLGLEAYLVFCDDFLQQLYQQFFYVPGHEFSGGVLLSNLLEFFIILQEEAQVVVWNVHGQVSPLFTLLLCSRLTAREGVFIDFVFNLVLCVSQQDAAVWVRGGHLSPEAVESWEELRVDTARLLVLKSLGNVPSHSEIWILVDSLGNQAENLRVLAKNVWESIRKGRNGLDCWERNSANVVAWSKPENVLAYRVIMKKSLSLH